MPRNYDFQFLTLKKQGQTDNKTTTEGKPKQRQKMKIKKKYEKMVHIVIAIYDSLSPHCVCKPKYD